MGPGNQTVSCAHTDPHDTVPIKSRAAIANGGTKAQAMDEKKHATEGEHKDDHHSQGLFKLPPEFRLQIYDYVFDLALSDDKQNQDRCFPVPPIVRAWPELKLECGSQWQRRLCQESDRLLRYQLITLTRRKTEGSITEQFKLMGEELATRYRERQIEVLMGHYNAPCKSHIGQ